MLNYRLPFLSRLKYWPVVLGVLATSLSGAQSGKVRDDQLPLFDLEEVEVIYNPTDFAPSFSGDMPQFTYYEAPKLPNGDLVLALEFMDRYRDTLIPGDIKWAGMLLFPVIDGHERKLLKWLCLYFYNDTMYGYDPNGYYDYDRRFYIPIQFEDRKNQDVLFRFASNFVADVFPAREEEVYFVEEPDPEDEEGVVQEFYETIESPAGRIEGFLNSHKGKEPKELVRIVYEHSENPNPGTGTKAALGKPMEEETRKFSWADLLRPRTGHEDHLRQAEMLLKPRWTQQVKFHYEKDFLFWDLNARSRGLLFNIGPHVYTYSPKWGVWRTKATIYDLDNLELFASKLEYPGVEKVLRLEFIPPDLEDVVLGEATDNKQ